MNRELLALMVADAVGYSRWMEADEAAALAALAASRAIIDPAVVSEGGRIVKTGGDSVIAAFPTAVGAVSAALAMQRGLGEAEAAFRFRIGIHFGDVVVSKGDIHGDGLNLAARLEPLAPTGGIAISGTVADQIAGKIDGAFTGVGRHRLKNIARPIELYIWPEAAARQRRRRTYARRGGVLAASLAALAGAGVLWWFALAGREPGMATGPRIVVLPFSEIGRTGEEAFFAEGLSRDINAFLTEFSNLFVLAPSASAALRNADCATIRSELGADFILGGTVRRAGDSLRVTTDFTDARTCRQLDAPGPFDRDLSAESVLDLQLDIARRVVSEIGSADAPIFDASVVNRIEQAAPDSLTAYECVLLSYWFYENFAPERHRRARNCLIRAVETDPNYSLAWSRLAFAWIESKKYDLDPVADWAERAEVAAQRAIDLDSNNPDAYYAMAIRSQILGEDRATFRRFAEKAVALNPNDSFVLADLGTWMAYAGEWEKGKEWVTRAKRLNPKHQSWWNFIWQLHAFLESDYDASIEHAQVVNLPGNYMVQAALTAAYAMNGEQDLAGQTLARVLELKPDYAADPRQPFRARNMDPDLIEGLMEGLRRAGLDVPEAADPGSAQRNLSIR